MIGWWRSTSSDQQPWSPSRAPETRSSMSVVTVVRVTFTIVVLSRAVGAIGQPWCFGRLEAVLQVTPPVFTAVQVERTGRPWTTMSSPAVSHGSTRGDEMPKTTKSGKPKQSELPSTLQNSSGKAQRTFTKAYDAAIDQYGDEQRAHQVAFAALKHTHEKVGDTWKKKHKGKKGPS